LRYLRIAVAIAALWMVGACERADDRAVKPLSGQLDLRYCRKGADDGLIFPAGGCLMSPNRAFAMVMDQDGALSVAPVLPAGSIGAPVWSSGSRSPKRGRAWARLQPDGNLVITDEGAPIWDSKSYGATDRYHLAVSDTGSLVITNAKGETTWSSRLDLQACVSGFDSVAHIVGSVCLTSPNKAYVLFMNRAGALQVSSVQGGAVGAAIWSSGSKSQTPGNAGGILQDDGNLVVYEGSQPLWNSKSFGASGHYHLALADDGDLMLSNDKGAVVWSSAHGLAAKS
jgi:hypothetical protein